MTVSLCICVAVTMVLWWRAIAKAANEWIVWLCVMNYDLQSIPNGTVWKIFALLCELKTRSNVKYREVETHQTRRCFLSLLLSSVAELCVSWKSQRPVPGWQERWPSVAPCCCSQWLDHLIMMFVLMSSCTDVPEKKAIWWACSFCLRCIFLTNVLWQSGDGIVKLLNSSDGKLCEIKPTTIVEPCLQ